ncbi:MAG: biotin synthase BioB [Oceanococcaceae bacterium]
MAPSDASTVRHDWRADEVQALFALPFPELLFRAQQVHRRHHAADRVQLSTLMNIKTGGCPEDCKYCSQSIRYDTGLEKETLAAVEEVREAAQRAQAAGATRFCMGAAWRGPKARDMGVVKAMIAEVKALGMESCMTLGLLDDAQAAELAAAGLDYYNHNIDTSPEYYDKVITTRTFQSRLDTHAHVREAGIKVCAGGILGLGESRADRAEMLRTLANLPAHPDSVPINQLVAVPGTPFAENTGVDILEFVRTIAVARILMPKAVVRLSAGRSAMDDAAQALCFTAGANSMFYGDKLLTTGNPDVEADRHLLDRLGLQPTTVTVRNALADAPPDAAHHVSAEARECVAGVR